MRQIGDKIFIYRGESFMLSFDIVDNNRVPFVPTKAMQHAYILVTIASDIYSIPRKQLAKRWISIDDNYTLFDSD